MLKVDINKLKCLHHFIWSLSLYRHVFCKICIQSLTCTKVTFVMKMLLKLLSASSFLDSAINSFISTVIWSGHTRGKPESRGNYEKSREIVVCLVCYCSCYGHKITQVLLSNVDMHKMDCKHSTHRPVCIHVVV